MQTNIFLILNTCLPWTDKGVDSCTQLFVKWSFVLVYPTSLILHKSKYSIIFLVFDVTYLNAKLLFIMCKL